MEYLPLIDRSRTLYKRSDVTPIFAEPAAFAMDPELISHMTYALGIRSDLP
jgi:hypothetical protein